MELYDGASVAMLFQFWIEVSMRKSYMASIADVADRRARIFSFQNVRC